LKPGLAVESIKRLLGEALVAGHIPDEATEEQLFDYADRNFIPGEKIK